jgi:hypothetical protein
VRRPLVILLVALLPLFVTQAASTAVKDFGATTVVTPAGPGQYTAMIQNTDIDAGSCVMSGATFTCSGLGLATAACFCVPGGIVNVTFTGSGDGGSSTIAQVGSPGANAAANPAPTGVVAPTTTVSNVQLATTKVATKATSTKKTVKKVKIPICKKGQRSTKTKPCTKH